MRAEADEDPRRPNPDVTRGAKPEEVAAAALKRRDLLAKLLAEIER
jgi:hypothetical protein